MGGRDDLARRAPPADLGLELVDDRRRRRPRRRDHAPPSSGAGRRIRLTTALPSAPRRTRLVEREPSLREPRHERGLLRIRDRPSDRHEADEVDVVGHVEQRLHGGDRLGENAEDATREPLVDRGELEQDERRARVDIPEGPGADLLAWRSLCRPAVALVTALLPRADEDVHGRRRDLGLAACGDVSPPRRRGEPARRASRAPSRRRAGAPG